MLKKIIIILITTTTTFLPLNCLLLLFFGPALVFIFASFFFFSNCFCLEKFGLVDAEEENDKLARIEKSNCLVEINTRKYQLQSNIYGVGYVECGPSFDWTQCVA